MSIEKRTLNGQTFSNMLLMALASGLGFGFVLIVAVFLMAKPVYAQGLMLDSSMCYISEEVSNSDSEAWQYVSSVNKGVSSTAVTMNFIIGVLIFLTAALVLLITDRRQMDAVALRGHSNSGALLSSKSFS